MKEASEASVPLQGRWKKHEERKYSLDNILEAAGTPAQAPEPLKDLALEKKRSIRNFTL